MKPILILLLTAAFARAAVVNGDFETNSLAPWATFTDPNGTLAPGLPDVVLFDTDNDGTASPAAHFNVGRILQSFTTPEGGGIHQSIQLWPGTLNLCADIAFYTPYNQGECGLFELILDGQVLDSHDFGEHLFDTYGYDTLAATVSITAPGAYDLRFRIARGFANSENTPDQYIDNITASGSAVVPEPACMWLGVLAWLLVKRSH